MSHYTVTTTNGTYSVIVTNAAGSTNASWQVHVLLPGSVWGWGDDSLNQSDAPPLTNVAAIAAGPYHSLAAKDDGNVIMWGDSTQLAPPTNLNHVVSVAAGAYHDLALKSDGSVVSWGRDDFNQTNVPTDIVSNAIAISAGGNQSLALLNDGTVRQWGQTNMAVPGIVSNVTAIATGTNFQLALLGNGTVVPWGTNDLGQTNVPTGLTNVVGIAAGAHHGLALKSDGTVVSWGDNTYGQTNVPTTLSNVIAVAAGQAHSVALINDGTVVSWGDNSSGQTNSTQLSHVKLIAAGGNHSLAAIFSPLIQYYPLTAAKDLLLIYNTSSVDSSNVMSYYLTNRPMVANANVLGIACTTNEITLPGDFSNQVLAPYLNWMTQNPTKRPEYVVLFLDIPSRVEDTGTNYPSVQYQLSTDTPGAIQPLVTSINMNGTNDCIGYIKKLKMFGSNSPGKLVISASAGGYGNTNYVIDNVRAPGLNNAYADSTVVSDATNGLSGAGISAAAILYRDGVETNSNLPHLTNAPNVAGYISWGFHSSLGSSYATNGVVIWTGNSSWYVIETVESFNGFRVGDGGNFIMWFSSNAFGGTNYSNTPVGAVTHVEEPFLVGIENSSIYFGLWAGGKNFAISAWNSRQTPYFQAVGDPLITK